MLYWALVWTIASDFLSPQLHSSSKKPNIECFKRGWSASHLVRPSTHFICCCCSESGCCPTWHWEKSLCYCSQHQSQFYCQRSHRSYAIRASSGVRCFRIEIVAVIAISRQPHRCSSFPCFTFSTSIASCFLLHLGAVPLYLLLSCFSLILRAFH